MTIYAIVDENLEIARHLSKGTMGVFSDLNRLKKHAWRYQKPHKEYKIAEFEMEQIYAFSERNEREREGQ